MFIMTNVPFGVGVLLQGYLGQDTGRFGEPRMDGYLWVCSVVADDILTNAQEQRIEEIPEDESEVNKRT